MLSDDLVLIQELSFKITTVTMKNISFSYSHSQGVDLPLYLK